MFQVSIVSFTPTPSPPGPTGWEKFGVLKVCLQYQALTMYIDNLKALRKEEKIFFSMPARKGDDGLWKETITFPKELLYQFNDACSDALKAHISQGQGTWAPPSTPPVQPSYPDGYTALARMPSPQVPPSQEKIVPYTHEECPF